MHAARLAVEPAAELFETVRIMKGGRRSVKPLAVIANDDGSLTDLIESLSLLPWPLQDLK
jgi:hypothetical protein